MNVSIETLSATKTPDLDSGAADEVHLKYVAFPSIDDLVDQALEYASISDYEGFKTDDGLAMYVLDAMENNKDCTYIRMMQLLDSPTRMKQRLEKQDATPGEHVKKMTETTDKRIFLEAFYYQVLLALGHDEGKANHYGYKFMSPTGENEAKTFINSVREKALYRAN
ncbi:hypothetical protein ACFL0W_00705 [Nanoarchaeota archaeon]